MNCWRRNRGGDPESGAYDRSRSVFSLSPARRGHIWRALIVAFGLMVILCFAGIFWTATGAPGHRYYQGLREPIAIGFLISFPGLVFTLLPSVISLANRNTRRPNPPEASEEQLEARARDLSRLLPLVAKARTKEKIQAMILAAFFSAGAYLGWRHNRIPLLLVSLTIILVIAWEIVRLSLEKVELAMDTITFRTITGRFVYRYAEIENVEPAPGGRMKIWLKGGLKYSMNPGIYNDEDLLLILTERQLSQQDGSKNDSPIVC